MSDKEIIDRMEINFPPTETFDRLKEDIISEIHSAEERAVKEFKERCKKLPIYQSRVQTEGNIIKLKEAILRDDIINLE